MNTNMAMTDTIDEIEIERNTIKDNADTTTYFSTGVSFDFNR